MPAESPTRTIIRVSSISEMIVGCPAKVPHLQAGRPRPQHWTAARGTALHAAMQHVMSERMTGRMVTAVEAREVFDGVWLVEQEAVDDWSFDGGTVKPAEVHARSAEMLNTLYLATRTVRPVAVEQTWFWDVPPESDGDPLYTLQGTIDCIAEPDTAVIDINDWKSAAKPWGRYKKAHQWQHKGYLLLYQHNAPQDWPHPRRFSWWSTDQATNECERIDHVYGADSLAQAEAELYGALRQLSKDYLPRKNDPEICKFCDYRSTGGC
jgi:hypothetical protein